MNPLGAGCKLIPGWKAAIPLCVNHRPKHIIEYAALRIVAFVVSVLPERCALAIGWVLAWIGHHIVRFRAVEARRRIREVFGDRLSPRDVRRCAWVSFRNTVFNAIEVMRMPKVTREWVDAHIEQDGIERVADLAKSGKGSILVVPHTGNWDLSGVAAQTFGVPMFFVVGKQRNLLVDAWLNRMRGITGIETIPRDSSVLKKVIKNLREGKVLAFMTDLRSKTPGVQVRFLGKTANVVGGMGLFARQADVPIFPVVVTRVGWTRHRWRFHEPIYPDPTQEKSADWQRMTQRVMDIYDAAIRAEPEQYFWYNKRWVLDPLEPTGSAVPAPSPSATPAQSAPGTIPDTPGS